ncbi:carbohydrate ABC transporter permease [Alteribacillus sp. HJP-4]|uniref:carbohydrate ABC transporter permease n=1 Tax=Alteribacillus sp. HJP-4 TaxID=2775394 RepID=UPI0035CD3680
MDHLQRYQTKSYKTFKVFNYIFLGLAALVCILPMIHLLAVSLSGSAAASAGAVSLLPVNFTTEAYMETLGNRNFLDALRNGILRVVLGTAVSMGLLLCAAYAISKNEQEFRGRNFYTWFFVFTMLFNGGLVPTYIVVTSLGLSNSIWALVLPVAINAFNLVLLMNFFRTSVPKSLDEAATIDGANHFNIFMRIYLPVSLPAIATISLFTMVFHWNSWFDGLIYMNDASRYPLSTFLQTIIVQQDYSSMDMDAATVRNLNQRTVESAQIFIAALPMLIVYPFLQKYFVKGIVLGSEKE